MNIHIASEPWQINLGKGYRLEAHVEPFTCQGGKVFEDLDKQDAIEHCNFMIFCQG